MNFVPYRDRVEIPPPSYENVIEFGTNPLEYYIGRDDWEGFMRHMRSANTDVTHAMMVDALKLALKGYDTRFVQALVEDQYPSVARDAIGPFLNRALLNYDGDGDDVEMLAAVLLELEDWDPADRLSAALDILITMYKDIEAFFRNMKARGGLDQPVAHYVEAAGRSRVLLPRSFTHRDVDDLVEAGFSATEAEVVRRAAGVHWDKILGYLLSGTDRNPPIDDDEWDRWARALLEENPDRRDDIIELAIARKRLPPKRRRIALEQLEWHGDDDDDDSVGDASDFDPDMAYASDAESPRLPEEVSTGLTIVYDKLYGMATGSVSGIDSFDFDEIRGDLMIGFNANIGMLDMPNLQYVGGMLCIRDNNLALFHFPVLESVGLLDVQEDLSGTAAFPALRHVGRFAPTCHPAVVAELESQMPDTAADRQRQEARIDELVRSRRDGDLTLVRDELVPVPAGNYQPELGAHAFISSRVVDGNLSVINNAIPSLHMDILGSVGGTLEISGNAALRDASFDVLASVGTLDVRDQGRIVWFADTHFPALMHVDRFAQTCSQALVRQLTARAGFTVG